MPPTRRPALHTLADLPQLGAARVVRVEGHDLAAERLIALGFTPGTEVRYERRAPFGGPIIAWTRGAMICLRPKEALRIVVEALP